MAAQHNWRYYDDDACTQCKRRQLCAASEQAQRRVGLEVQQPWAKLLLEGAKSIETRNYPLPPSLLGRPIALIRTEQGASGVSGLPNVVPAAHPDVAVVGTVVFGECVEYTSRKQWDADAKRHCVPSDDAAYAFVEGDSPKFGWVVQRCEAADKPRPIPTLRRRVRSLFLLDNDDPGPE